MKSIIIILISGLLFFNSANSQDSNAPIDGAWQTSVQGESGGSMTMTLMIQDGYFSQTKYSILQQKFHNTRGGKLEINNDQLIYTIEYDTEHPDKVGSVERSDFKLSENQLSLKIGDSDMNKVTFLEMPEFSGAYLITGRKRNGEISRRTPGARKTMKILAGPYFQWIAYNTDTGEFFGTGGGTYSAKEGSYTEEIEFFSRDGSRVGAILTFDYSIQDDEWHHSGLSSKGSPIYEIWTPRSQLD